MAEIAQKIVQTVIQEFINRLNCMSGTGNGIGKGTVEKIRQFAEKEGFIKPKI
jgi:hypothetical protein